MHNLSKKPIPLFFGIFLLAAAFRFIRLNVMPLNHAEAALALQALSVVEGTQVRFGSEIAYVGLTSIFFFLFSANTFLARFWPALSGSLLIWVPYLFKKQTGTWPALIAAAILAISPDMIALSRIVGSPMMAMVFLLLAIGLYLNRQPIGSGICFALGLMSGPGFWIGLLITGISLMIGELGFGIKKNFDIESLKQTKRQWVRLGSAFGLTLLVVGTNFFMAPSGLSGVFSGLYQFVTGFFHTSILPMRYVLLALFGYCGAAVLFGLWGGINSLKNKNDLDRFLLIWALAALVFIIIYPARRTADLVWLTFPIWVLAARTIYQAWYYPERAQYVPIVTAILLITLSAFIMLILRSLTSPIVLQPEQNNYFIALVGGVVLMIAIMIMVSYGWSAAYARSGLIIGLVIVSIVGMISISVNSTSLAPSPKHSIWLDDEPMLTSRWMTQSIERVKIWNARGIDPVDIAVINLDLPGMRWHLINFRSVHFTPFLSPSADHGILITDVQENPEIVSSYLGQKLVWSQHINWQALTGQQVLSWAITGEAPVISDEIILWVRTDLVPADEFSK